MTNEGVQHVEIRGHKINLYRDEDDTKGYLFDVLPKVLAVIDEKETQRLQDKKYCKEKFDLNFPAITMSSKNGLDKNGHRRFYPELLKDKYWVCSQWYDTPAQPNFTMWIDYLFELRDRFGNNGIDN
ncbi:protein of unknown function [Pseudodesulfovibrio profundus]|uniref:Uncharacterized protein n=1 Tax=Pseudodesulfovibrio profundus TaxID=57320 RepID=A0A2C8FBV3_9BACT|nr:hypothetical protein [Pseudodesulfovibrio profundus]SOB59971.1 protein of unknown function [Pseudodesulfovibrio profundus]